MHIQRVAILGAGNGGITAAADLTLRGSEQLSSKKQKANGRRSSPT